MKTQIITLESHDDLISVRDRLSWAKTPRILLVWPKFEKVTLRQVDLKILQRHASSLGAQLGLVTRTRRVREDAEALGIPVFESPGQAQRVSWPHVSPKRAPRRAPARNLREKREQVSVKEEAWRAHPVTRLGMFTVGVMSVITLVALFIPRARVTLKPVSDIQRVVLPVVASATVESVFITGSIPARELILDLDGTQTVLVTGEGVVPQSKAGGVVEFRNLTQLSVPVPAGTVVTADEVRFVTMEAVVIEGGVGKRLEAPILAIEGGLSGNVESEAITAIDGRLGLSLSASNPEPTFGGRELASLQASDADRAHAKELLLEFLDDQAREKFLNEIDSGDMLIEGTISVSQILLENYDPPSGAAGKNLTLTMQVEYSARYVSASDLTELGLLALNASLPSGFRAASAADSLTLEPVTTPTLQEDGSARWTMRAERRIVQAIDPAVVTNLILGSGMHTAQSRLDATLPLANSPVISISPSWWPWIPLVPYRVEVVTE